MNWKFSPQNGRMMPVVQCPTCKGLGQTMQQASRHMPARKEWCPTCGGSGEVVNKTPYNNIN